MFSINQPISDFVSRHDSHLHSTMFSINQNPRRKRIIMKIIYIPLCFLLIQVRNQFFDIRIRIYIPLCFLLIQIGLQITLKAFLFTFHYVFY